MIASRISSLIARYSFMSLVRRYAKTSSWRLKSPKSTNRTRAGSGSTRASLRSIRCSSAITLRSCAGVVS